MAPEFPIRILFDDGDCLVIDSPEELVAQLDTVDSSAPEVWVRDAVDRNVRLVMRNGIVETLEVMGNE